jgi:phosphoglycerate dehydrogenase-like enzyme
MKPGAILLNYSRGGLVDEPALAGHLKDGRLAGAALDVFEAEPLPPASPLLSAPNLLLTPHIGYRTTQALRRKAEITFENIVDFERGLMTNRVDLG